MPTKRPPKAVARRTAKPKRTTRANVSEARTTKKTPRFGRPGTAGKAEGDDAVAAWIAGVRPDQRALVERLDALVAEEIPDVKRAVKWSMPMYGREGVGYFAHVGAFKAHVALGFFAGTRLTPPIPAGEGKDMRRAKFRTLGDVDEKIVRGWIRQAAATKGWGRA